MKLEADMSCTPIASDGQTTIGRVDEWAARWDGHLVTLQVGEDFEYADDGEEYEADGTYVVREANWSKVPADARTLFLNSRIRSKHVSPDQLEDLGRSLFVNGRDFAETLKTSGQWIDPVDGKLFEWK